MFCLVFTPIVFTSCLFLGRFAFSLNYALRNSSRGRIVSSIGSYARPRRKTRWNASDHEQLLLVSLLFSSHHSGTSWFLSHLPIGRCSRTVLLLFLSLTKRFRSCDEPSVFTLVKVPLDCSRLAPGERSRSGQLSWRGFFTKGRILRSSTAVVSCGLPGLLFFPSTPVWCFFGSSSATMALLHWQWEHFGRHLES